MVGGWVGWAPHARPMPLPLPPDDPSDRGWVEATVPPAKFVCHPGRGASWVRARWCCRLLGGGASCAGSGVSPLGRHCSHRDGRRRPSEARRALRRLGRSARAGAEGIAQTVNILPMTEWRRDHLDFLHAQTTSIRSALRLGQRLPRLDDLAEGQLDAIMVPDGRLDAADRRRALNVRQVPDGRRYQRPM